MLLVRPFSGRTLHLYLIYKSKYLPPFSPFSQSVWIALEAKGLSYQYCEEDPYKVAASQPLLEANPRGTVPAIRQGDWACADSGVILEYVSQTPPRMRMLPPHRTPSLLIICNIAGHTARRHGQHNPTLPIRRKAPRKLSTMDRPR